MLSPTAPYAGPCMGRRVRAAAERLRADPHRVLSVIDRYLLRQILATCLVMTAIGLTVLLLERVLYLFSLVANPSNALSYVGQMLLLLTPHYLSIALPAAFFFGVLLTFGRLKQDGEFVVLMAAGCGLGRLLAPVLGLAAIMTMIAVLILGFLNPHAHYAYRALKHTVAQASLTAAVLEGTFIQADGLTFFAEARRGRPGRAGAGAGVRPPGRRGRRDHRGHRPQRQLARNAEDGRPVLMLEQGVRAEIAADGAAPMPCRSAISAGRWRPRPRRFGRAGATRTSSRCSSCGRRAGTPRRVQAERGRDRRRAAHAPGADRFGAVAAAAGGAAWRSPGRCAAGAAASSIGLLILIVYYEALNFGDAMAKRDCWRRSSVCGCRSRAPARGPLAAAARAAGQAPGRDVRTRAAAGDARQRMTSIISRYVGRLLLGRFAILLLGLAA